MSTIRADSVAPSAGGTSRSLPRGVTAAWANLNGTGTIALRDSQNISSTTDNGTGDYSFNKTASMTSANYSNGGMFVPALGASATTGRVLMMHTRAAGSTRIQCNDNGGLKVDFEDVSLQDFGSLA